MRTGLSDVSLNHSSHSALNKGLTKSENYTEKGNKIFNKSILQRTPEGRRNRKINRPRGGWQKKPYNAGKTDAIYRKSSKIAYVDPEIDKVKLGKR